MGELQRPAGHGPARHLYAAPERVAEQGDMTKLRCHAALVEETLHSLRSAGFKRKESIVLWLGVVAAAAASADVAKTYVPRHEAKQDWFRVPPDAMRELMTHLRAERLAVIAQVHSHPDKAFH